MDSGKNRQIHRQGGRNTTINEDMEDVHLDMSSCLEHSYDNATSHEEDESLADSGKMLIGVTMEEDTLSSPGDESKGDQKLLPSGVVSSLTYEDITPEGAPSEKSAFEIAANSLQKSKRPEGKQKLVNLIISSVLGNMLEWYDFGVFASFSTELSKAFFTGGKLEEMLKVYGVFAAAFFARPLGGFLLGLIGDRYSRTLSLQISVVAMGSSALVIAILPANSLGPYSIGVSATFLLVFARIVQGLSVGGEMVGSMLYMVENVPEKWKCLVSCVPMSAAITGTGCGYLVSTIITATLSEEARTLWGWRLAFALGVPAGGVGFMFRTCLSESHSFTDASARFASRHGNQHPFFYGLKNCPVALLIILTLCMLVCGFYSGTIWYMEAWLEQFYTGLIDEKSLTVAEGRAITTLLIIFVMGGGALLMAFIIDTRKSTPLHHYLIFSGSCLTLLTPFFLWLMSKGNTCMACVVVGQVAQSVFFTPAIAPLALWLTLQLPSTLQYTGIALSYNIAQALFGGTLPYIATLIIANSSILIAPSFYLSALALTGTIGALLSQLGFVRRMHENLDMTMKN